MYSSLPNFTLIGISWNLGVPETSGDNHQI